MNQIEVTHRQNEYLQELASGAKSTQDLVLSLMVSAKSVGKMIKILRDKGLVQSAYIPGSRGASQQYRLVKSYPMLVLDGLVVAKIKHNSIPDIELYHVAGLRSGGMTGQRLVKAHQRLFPERKANTVRHVVTKAVALGLCR